MTAGVLVLGSLEAEVGGTQVDLGGPRQRAVLALLLAGRTQVISVNRLIDQHWRGEPPRRARPRRPTPPDQATGYFTQAETLARRWNSLHWTERARTARAGL